MDFRRLISVWDLREVEACFMFCGLANRDDVIVVLAPCMRNGDNFSIKQSEREEPLFSVGLAGIFRSDRVARKDFLGVCEVDAVIVEVFLELDLVPREHAEV